MYSTSWRTTTTRGSPDYRDLSPQDEWALLEQGFNRVTDTCIPEDEAIRRIESHIFDLWKKVNDKGESRLPHEYFYELLKSGILKQYYQIDPKDSWLLAAAERNLPIIVPGWEDSTLGNIFASYCITGELKATTMKAGIEYMVFLAGWYQKNCAAPGIGFFQIGGGIAGDFPICVVPMLQQDLKKEETPFWGYFCQISDSTTSYGSYSGAVPNEKITWGKLSTDTAEVRDRVRRDDSRSSHIRLDTGLVGKDAFDGWPVSGQPFFLAYGRRPFFMLKSHLPLCSLAGGI